MLKFVKMLFELNGALSGYKTYMAAFAGLLALTANFINASLIPFIDGDLSLVALLSSDAPQYIAMAAGFWTAGALRAGVKSAGKI